MKRFALVTLALLVAAALSACDQSRPFVLDTRLTDALTLDVDYDGKNFLEDGIGEAVLASCEDGDTAEFYVGDERIRVRFLSIDAPEASGDWEPWGYHASEFACEKLTNATTIVLEGEPTQTHGTYGRPLAWVWYDGRMLNLELVELAYAIGRSPSNVKYESLFNEADEHIREVGKRVYERDGTDPLWDYSRDPQDVSLQTLVEDPENHWFAHVNVEGVVTRNLGDHAYIQEGDFGVFVFIGHNQTARFAIGNHVRIEQARFVNDLPRRNGWHISDVGLGRGPANHVTVLSEGNVVAPHTLRLDEADATHYGRFVIIENLTFQSATRYHGETKATFIDANDEAIIVIVNDMVPEEERVDFSDFESGQTVTLSGIYTNHIEGDALLLLQASDVGWD